jgi:hypothetical protein
MPLEADHPGERPARVSPALLVAGLTVLAFALRFGRLGHWGFDSDEIFMLRDSIHPKLTNPRPLLYFLNHLLAIGNSARLTRKVASTRFPSRQST